MPLVAQPEIEGESVTDGDMVLDEERHGTLVDAVSSVSPSVMLNALAVPVRNASTLGKLNDPVPSAKFSLMEVTVLPAEFHRVPAAHVAECVDEDVRGVIPSLGEGDRSAEVEAAGDGHLRQADRADDSILRFRSLPD